MSQLSLNNKYIAEALSPEQRAAAQSILDKETGADKKKDEKAERMKRSEIRKEKELQLKQANLEIRKKREKRRDETKSERSADKVAREKAAALKDKQRGLAAKVKEKSKEASGAKQAAVKSLSNAKPKETITDKDGDGTALGKLGANTARAGLGIAGATINRIKSARLQQAAKKKQGELDRTKEVKEDTLVEVDELDSKEKKTNKVIDIMKGKNKIEVNPQIKAEGVVNQVKKGVKRHKDAVEKKKIKDRKAVPYAVLAAENEPQGKMVEAKYDNTKSPDYEKKKKALAKKHGGEDKIKDHPQYKESADYGSKTARRGDNEAAAAARKRIYDRASAKDKDYMDAREIAHQRNKERAKKIKVKEDVKITDAKGRDFLEIIDIIKPEPMKSPKNTVQWTEEKIARLMKKANEKKRKNALQINKIVGTQ